MGKKEDNIKKATALMDKLNYIRNIDIAAHIDHGKCVSGDSLVSLTSGENIQAKELFEKFEKNGTIIKNDIDEKIIQVNGLYVNSLDKNSKKIKEGKVTHVWRMKKTDPLIEIKTENGRSVKTTPEHKFLVLNSENGQIFEKRADAVELEDVVVCTRKLLHHGITEKQLKVEILRRLGVDEGFYTLVSKDLKERLHREILAVGVNEIYSQLDTRIKQKSFYHMVWRGEYRVGILVKICEFLKIDLAEVYSKLKWINYRGIAQKGSSSSLQMKLPVDFEEFYYLAGLFFGDGDSDGNITNNHPFIQQRVKKIGKHLGLNCNIRTFENRASRIEIGGITLKKLLQSLFKYPERKKSCNTTISRLLEVSPKNFISAFIRGYMDADGTVEKGRSAVSVGSVSKKFLNKLQLLLYKFDIGSIFNRKKSVIYISGKSSLEMFKEIGFTVPDKKIRFIDLLEKSKVSKLDYIPISGQVLKNIRSKTNISAHSIFRYYRNYEENIVGLSKYSLQNILERFSYLGIDDNSLSDFKGLTSFDLMFLRVSSIKKTFNEEYVYDFSVEQLHNFVADGMIIHNTTFSDNLLAGCGMMSEELAGKQLVLDYDEQEQTRGITINAAAASMVHTFEGKEYLINLIDTPGHVDFGGDVTRAMRAVDGCIVLVCAVEGAMPQTETVVRQALREKVKPVLFINKVDRLINELKLNPQEMQQRFVNIISKFNELVNKMVPDEFKGKWNVKVEDGSVAFGSAFHNWAISAPYMSKTKMGFKDIYDYLARNDQKTLSKKLPIHEVVLDMVVDHLPSPDIAQRYRIPHIWKGDINSELGKSMIATKKDGPLALMITKIILDPHAGEVAIGRMYSGKIIQGQEVHVAGMPKLNRVQQVNLMVGADKIPVEFVSAGNIVAATGIRDAIAGSTVTDDSDAEPFERIVHISEPVVTVAVEAKNMKDLPKLIEVLRMISKADPSIQVNINQETGENLMSGMGELHLEITEYRIRNEHKVDIITSEPIVVYRESVGQKSTSEFEGKSPNKHNRFYIEVEPLPDNIIKALYNNEIPQNVKKFKNEVQKKLQDLGMEKDLAKGVFGICGLNIITDTTKGIQYLFETRELIKEAFDEVMKSGPIADEPCQGLLVKLMDAKLHEDAIHRGPAQVIPAVRNAIYGSIMSSDPILLEPMQKVFISTPQELMGDASRELNQRRAIVRDMQTDKDLVNIDAKAPVAEMFGFASSIRSATGGRVLWNTENLGFEPLPKHLQVNIIKNIRERKGLKPEPYPPNYYLG